MWMPPVYMPFLQYEESHKHTVTKPPWATRNFPYLRSDYSKSHGSILPVNHRNQAKPLACPPDSLSIYHRVDYYNCKLLAYKRTSWRWSIPSFHWTTGRNTEPRGEISDSIPVSSCLGQEAWQLFRCDLPNIYWWSNLYSLCSFYRWYLLGKIPITF